MSIIFFKIISISLYLHFINLFVQDHFCCERERERERETL